ncbi:transposase [Pseudomonas capeferrum]|nr:transposase [Pseudomonas capeferrum]
MLSPGEQADLRYFMPLLDQISQPGIEGRPRKRCRYVLADKGYGSQVLRQDCDRYGMQPVIPLCKMHRKPRPGLPRLFDGPQYKKRNVIERLFSWFKEKRRLCTRYDKVASSFKAMVTLACIERCLRADFQTNPRGHAGGGCDPRDRDPAEGATAGSGARCSRQATLMRSLMLIISLRLIEPHGKNQNNS